MKFTKNKIKKLLVFIVGGSIFVFMPLYSDYELVFFKVIIIPQWVSPLIGLFIIIAGFVLTIKTGGSDK